MLVKKRLPLDAQQGSESVQSVQSAATADKLRPSRDFHQYHTHCTVPLPVFDSSRDFYNKKSMFSVPADHHYVSGRLKVFLKLNQ